VRTLDLLTLPLDAMRQQLARTVMTTLGVVFGSFVLAASLSIGQGVQDTIERESRRHDFLRKIAVHPKWTTGDVEEPAAEIDLPGRMSEERRTRLRRAMLDFRAHAGRQKPKAVLNAAKLAELAQLAHVAAVVPAMHERCNVTCEDQSYATYFAASRPENDEAQHRLIAGRLFKARDENAVIVSEFLLYRWGFQDEDQVASALGKTLRIELGNAGVANPGIQLHLNRPDGTPLTPAERRTLDQIVARLPNVLGSLDLSVEELALLAGMMDTGTASNEPPPAIELPIVGILRGSTPEEDKAPWDSLRIRADLALPSKLAEDFVLRAPSRRDEGLQQVVILVDDEEFTQQVYDEISAQGFNCHAVLEYVKQQRLLYMLIFGGMTCVAAVALLVASFGIANTMLMSVLERTREIGIMKAVGAASAQLQLMFLFEGALIGVVGGTLGLVLAYVASFPGDNWIRTRVASKLQLELNGSIFAFPGWLPVVVIGFAVIVTTLAAVYPARRAANIDPVTALRHE